MSTEYTIQHTAKGRFLVRDQSFRELGQFDNEADAQVFVSAKQNDDATKVLQWQQAEAEQRAYDATVPTLREAQLTWQEWRTWFYGAMRVADRDTGRMQRAIDMQAERFAGSPSFEKHENYLTDAMREGVEAAHMYEQAVALDSRIKAARRNRDTAALAEALAEAPALIEAMRPFFGNVGVPQPSPLKSSGTAPNASVVLTEGELQMIQDHFGGSKSAAIHAGLAALQRSK